MRRKIFIILSFAVFFIATSAMQAQVGIGTTTPFSQLDIRSSNQAAPANTDGMLIPKIDAFPATNPGVDQQGMLVYLTTATTFSGNPKPIGFYYWDNTSNDWIGITSTTNSDHDWYEVGTSTAPNAITDDMFHTGNVAIGKNTTSFPLEVNTTAYDKGINATFNSAVTNGNTKYGFDQTISGTSDDIQNGIRNTISSSGNGNQYGTRNNMTGTGSGTHIGTINDFTNGTGSLWGTYNRINNPNGAFHYGTFNDIFGDGGAKVGVRNLISGNTNTLDKGVENLMNGTGSAMQMGTYNSVGNNGSGVHYGVNNDLNNVGSGDQYGTYNSITNTGNGIHYGTYNILSGMGTGNQFGNYTEITNFGSGVHSGNEILLSGAGTGGQYGNSITITNSGNSAHFGTANRLNGGGTGVHYGTYNTLGGAGTGQQVGTYNQLNGSGLGDNYGVQNFLTGSGNGIQYGYFSTITNLGSGLKYGIRNELTGAGNQFGGYFLLGGSGAGTQTGLYNEISNSGGNSHYGIVSSLSGAGAGTKMGLYSIINPAAGGTHYGIYSEALKPGATNFAGYFLGNVGIGTTTGNTYTLPASRGTNNQIMVTNGTGTVSWQNASAIQDHDWYEVGGTLAPDAITDNMFHTGNVAIGKNTAAYALDVTSAGRTINSVSTSGTNAAIYGANTTASGTGNGGHGVYGSTIQSNSSAVRGDQTHIDGDALTGLNLGAIGTGAGCGSYGLTYQSNGFGQMGENYNNSGTGIAASGQNVTAQYLVAGSGGAFTGFSTGIFARTTTAGNSECLYSNNFGNIVRVNYYNGTQYKIFGTGTVSTIAKGLNDEKVTLHCTEAPEIYFEDYGQGQLVKGRVHINIDPIIAKNITVNEKHPLRVFIQLEDECNGVYVTNKTGNSFDVIELAQGQSNAKFQYRIVGNRADEVLANGRISKNADVRFERVPDDYETREVKRKNFSGVTKP